MKGEKNRQEPPVYSLLLRNLVFTILQPGLVAGLIPYWILGIPFRQLLPVSWQLRHFAGALVFAMGLLLMAGCILSFALRGKGTLSPADPTRQLVISGFYRFSRNPMYVGVMMILMGEALFFYSAALLGYGIGVFGAFNLFILLVEEPRLKRDFGARYLGYCARVRRWL